MALIPIITNAGLKAAFDASQAQIALNITHIGVDMSGYAPNAEQTALHNEVVRLPIAGGVMASDTQIHLTAVDDTAREYWVRGLGFYLSDGTLFAVYSHPTQPIAFKSAETVFVHAYDLLLTAVPAGSVVVEAGAPNLSLYFAEEFGNIAIALVGSMQRELALKAQLDELKTSFAEMVDAQRTFQLQIKELVCSSTSLHLRADDTTDALSQVAAGVVSNSLKIINPLLK